MFMRFSTLVRLYLLDSQLANDSIADHIKDLGPAITWWAILIERYIGVLKGMVSLMSNINADLANKALISEHLNYLPNTNLPESDEDNNPDEANEANESINTLRTSKLVFP